MRATLTAALAMARPPYGLVSFRPLISDAPLMAEGWVAKVWRTKVPQKAYLNFYKISGISGENRSTNDTYFGIVAFSFVIQKT